MFPAPFLVTLLDRVKAIVRRVMRPAAERPDPVRADHPVQGANGTTACATLRGRAERWLSAKVAALSALLRCIETGAAVPHSVRAARTPKEAPEQVARRAVSATARLPRGNGWMCAFGPKVQQDGQAFAAWLDEPATQALVLAAPDQMARLIRPILTATGARRPAWFPTVRPQARAPRAAYREIVSLPDPDPLCGPCPWSAKHGEGPVIQSAYGSSFDVEPYRLVKAVIVTTHFQNAVGRREKRTTISLRYQNVKRCDRSRRIAKCAYPAATFTRRSA